MKHIYTLLLLFITTCSLSQNWEPFPHTTAMYSSEDSYKHFYLPLHNLNETDTFLGVGIGNMIDLIFSDNPTGDYQNMWLIDFLNDKAGFQSPLINNESRKTWLKTYKKNGNHIQFVSELDETIKIHLVESDTFFIANTQFYSLDTTYYISKIDSIEVLPSDSIIHFGIYEFNTNNKVLGSEIILSRNKGVLLMPIITFFPYCIPVHFEGQFSEVYPYNYSKKHMLHKHFQGDELHTIYEEGISIYFRTKVYTKKVYVNQTYNTDSTAFLNEVDVWTVKQERINFSITDPPEQTISFNSYTEQPYYLGNINSIAIPDGMFHFLDSNGAFIYRFNDDHWEGTQWNPLVSIDEILYPYLEKGYYDKSNFPHQEYEKRYIVYQQINGIESGNPISDSFFLSQTEYSNDVKYTLNNQGLSLLHPDRYKSGRIYSITGDFITYLTQEDLKNSINMDRFSGVHVLILITPDGKYRTLKF